MTTLDETALRALLDACMIADVERLEVFREIDSTNSFLRAGRAPARGAFRVAIADHQTAGRGRNENRWLSAPGGSLCLSLAHTFRRTPRDIPPLTLALGIGAAEVLESCGVENLKLKWPNDLMAGDAKLGGILAEAQYPRRGEAVIVAGIGLNLDLPDGLGVTAGPAYAAAVDLHSLLAEPPSRETLAVALILGWRRIFREFEAEGFRAFAERYARLDWLKGRSVVVVTAEDRVEGLAAGVGGDGSLLIETQAGISSVVSGSIVAVGAL